ncbi:hypothetical protein ABB02_00543 [Clostridiaceae bacterium JG1575]|nr:hypothetical protein ABB02_00543 [Clostridiaceae bacterium JG1575]
MKKAMGRKKKRGLWGILGLLLILGVGGIVFYRQSLLHVACATKKAYKGLESVRFEARHEGAFLGQSLNQRVDGRIRLKPWQEEVRLQYEALGVQLPLVTRRVAGADYYRLPATPLWLKGTLPSALKLPYETLWETLRQKMAPLARASLMQLKSLWELSQKLRVERTQEGTTYEGVDLLAPKQMTLLLQKGLPQELKAPFASVQVLKSTFRAGVDPSGVVRSMFVKFKLEGPMPLGRFPLTLFYKIQSINDVAPIVAPR